MHIQFNTLLITQSHWNFFHEMSLSFTAQNKQCSVNKELFSILCFPHFSVHSPYLCHRFQPDSESYKFAPWFFSSSLQLYLRALKSINQPLQYPSERESSMIPILQKRNWATKKFTTWASFLSFAIYSPLYDLICCSTCSAQLENSISKQTLWEKEHTSENLLCEI